MKQIRWGCSIMSLLAFCLIGVCFTRSGSAGDDSLVAELKTPGGQVRAIQFGPDGTWAVTATSSKLLVWDLKTAKVLKEIPVGTGRMALSQKGDVLIRTGNSKIHAIATSDWSEIWSGTIDGLITAVAISPTGNEVGIGTGSREIGKPEEYSVQIWDARAGKESFRMLGHKGPVVGIAFLSDGMKCVSASFDNSIRIWNLTTRTEERRIEKEAQVFPSNNNDPLSISIAPDSKQFFCKGTIWSLANGEAIRTANSFRSEVTQTLHVFSPDGRRVLCAGDDGSVRLQEANTGAELWMRYAQLNHTKVIALAFSPDGRFALTAGTGWKGLGTNLPGPGTDYTVRYWRLPE